MNDQPLLKWTGHPLADVGVATLCALADKRDPAELTLDDLDAAGAWIKTAYTDPIFMAYLSCVFTMNAPYTNPTMKGESREAAIQRVLFPHRTAPDADALGHACVFSGQPATHLIERSQMPMLTGAGVLNFFPAGLSELPVAAPYVLAIQAVALGGRRSEGKLLIAHSEDPETTLSFAFRYVRDNRRIIDLARADRLPEVEGPSLLLDRECAGWDKQKKRPKYPDVKSPTSLVMDDLVQVASETSLGAGDDSSASVTIYLISNSGQGPSLAIEHVPGAFVQFLRELHGSAHASRWRQLVSRAWRAGKEEAATDEDSGESASQKPRKKPSRPPSVPPGPGRSRNDLYNDLLPIFEHGFTNWQAASLFVRRHLLSDPTRFYMDLERVPHLPPKFGREQLELIDWPLTSLFLERVLGMDKERIEKIREFADHLAKLINDHNDKRLFRDLVFTAGEWQYRSLLTKVQRQYADDRKKLLFGYDTYIDLFLATDDQGRTIWSLVRDLISIRLVETLFELKFFERPENKDVLEPPEQMESEPEAEAAIAE